MYHFKDSIQDTKGNALTGYYVKVVDTGTGNLVDIYADDSLTPIVSVSAVDNAARVDSDGMADFWVASGTYHLDIYSLDALTLARRETNWQMLLPVDLTGADARYLQKSNNLSDVGNVVTARSNLGATTVGANLFTLTNPSAVTFPRYNADNSVSSLSASAFRTAIGAGTGGGDLVSTNNLSDLASASTGRTNLGLGSAAVLASSAVAQTANNLSDLASASTARTNLGLGSIAVEAEATAAQIQAGTASKAVAADKLVASAAPQTLTDGATVAWDMSTGYNAKVTIAGNRTLTVSNPVVGITYCLGVIQDSTGSRTMTWPASFDWGTTGAPTLTTTASKRDRITLFCTDAATPKFDAFLSGRGFS